MRTRSVLLAATGLAAMAVAPASAARPATAEETESIMEVFDQRITPDRWFCWRVTVSTVNETWATVQSETVSDDPYEQVEKCPETANGVAVFRYIYGGWEESWQASEPVSCDYKGMPRAVARDLEPEWALCRAANFYVMCADDPTEFRHPEIKPKQCNTAGRRQGYGNSVNLAKLKWRRWGTSVARATGIERGFKAPAEAIPVRVRAYRPRRDCMGDQVYTRMRVTSRYGSSLIRFKATEAFGGARCPEPA